eukprot:2441246-Rhodomonas_salina.2
MTSRHARRQSRTSHGEMAPKLQLATAEGRYSRQSRSCAAAVRNVYPDCDVNGSVWDLHSNALQMRLNQQKRPVPGHAASTFIARGAALPPGQGLEGPKRINSD